MYFDKDQESVLEWKYQGVLTYVDAKHFLDETPYTAAKINGAMKRFEKSEDGLPKPKTFIEMQRYVADLADFWLDANPEAHTDGEKILHEALSNYVAFSCVWKAKSKASNIVTPELMGQSGKMLVFKNTLGNAVKLVNSRLAHDDCPNRDLYGDFRNVLPDAFFILLPITQKITNGELTLPEGQSEDNLNRLLGAFFAGNPDVIAISDRLKQIEYKPDKAA